MGFFNVITTTYFLLDPRRMRGLIRLGRKAIRLARTIRWGRRRRAWWSGRRRRGWGKK